MMRTLAASLAFALVPLCGCSALKQEPPPPFEIMIHVESDPGRPLQGVVMTKGGKEAPNPTGPDGRVKLQIRGLEGESVDLFVKCPVGYASPTKPVSVSLRRSTKLAQYEVICPPTTRTLVVAVRADFAGNTSTIPTLPITYFGQKKAMTDANGAATIVFPAVKPGDQIELVLNTDDKGNERVSPKNPTAAFVVKPYDDVVTFDQKFNIGFAPIRYKPPPQRPVPIPMRH